MASEPSPLAPSIEDLAAAYRTGGDELAGHTTAQDVLCEGGAITVLCTAMAADGNEQSLLLRLGGDGELAWPRAYGLEHAAGRALAALPDGGYVIAGELRRSEFEYHAALTFLAPDGALRDERVYGASGLAGFNAVAVLADGTVVAAGTDRRQGLIVAGASERTLEQVSELVAVAAGTLVAGVFERSTTAFGLTWVAALDRWERRLPDCGRAEPAAVVAVDGGAIVAGHRELDGAPAELWVVRLDDGGDAVWERTLGAAGETRRARALALLRDGTLAVAGDALRGGRRELRLARLSADGEVLWERALGGEQDEQAYALAATDDGGLVLAGSIAGARTRACVRRLDADGTPLWVRLFP